MSVSTAEWERLLGETLLRRQTQRLLRTHRAVTRIDAAHVQIDGRTYTDFRSNDYLGLSHHPRLKDAIARTVNDRGWGSGAAALLGGWSDLHAAAQAKIAAWKGTEAAILLPSGYQANLAAISGYGIAGAMGRSLRFLADKQAHASLLDAVAGTGAPLRTFPHNQFQKLQRLLTDSPDGALDVVLTESIFSMDGDAADLPALVDLKQRHPFLLLVDEAHGTGVYGPGGSGYVAEKNLRAHVDVSVVTFSKAMGGIGGAVCASTRFCDALVNFARPYIYSTAIPPALAVGAMTAIDLMRDEPQRQQRVRALSVDLRARLARMSRNVTGVDSPIVPIVLGSEEATLTAAARLEERGLLVAAVRPPTVPPGASRLRISLSSEHTEQDLERLTDALSALD